MDKTILIKCVNTGETKRFSRGVNLQEVAGVMKPTLKNPILGALVNNKLTELNYEVYHPKNVQFIDITHPDGMRMYIRSLSFVLYKAVDELYPHARLRIEHSVSKGIYCELLNHHEDLSIQEVLQLGERMREIINKDLPFIREEAETEEVIKLFENRNMYDKTALMRHRGLVYTTYQKMNNHIGLFYGYMVPSTGYLNVFDLNKYYNGMLLQVPMKDNPDKVEDLIIQNKMFDIFQEFTQWNRVLNVTNVGDLNGTCYNGMAEQIIKVSEALHEKKIAQIADTIAERKGKVKIVLISGPSSSGKTTFGKRLAIQLLVAGIKPVNLSLDNYFVDREKTPLDEHGEYDFEALEALDIPKFNQDLTDLLEGKTVDIPKFSFETGKRFYDGEKLQMADENILIIEGIHGLNPGLTPAIPAEKKFKVYVSALTNINLDDHNRIHTTDNRLIRRIVRDYKYRNYSATDTLSRWQSVRRGEEKHIFPFQEEADMMFNTALLYELSVLKPLAEPILLEVPPNVPEYAEANRLLNFFSYFKPMQPREIPPTSIVREFLGGSSFNY
ncbi:nucleoside kinase [Marinilabiliaceae bacterium JC017]|nr:nucleoside kinase [Marinilabiliaceae bacterium JC017]